MQRTPRLRLGSKADVRCAGSLSRDVRREAQVELSEGFSYRRCTQIDADSFVSLACLAGRFDKFSSRQSDRQVVTAFLPRARGRRFLSDELSDAEQCAGANRAGPSGFALEFLVGSYQFSGRSAWTFGGVHRLRVINGVL